MTLLVTLLSVSLYLGVGLTAGAIMSRRTFSRSTYNRIGRAKQAAWWSFFFWPGLLVGTVLFAATVGTVRLAHRVMLPSEAR